MHRSALFLILLVSGLSTVDTLACDDYRRDLDVLAAVDTPGYACDLAVSGGVAFVADRDSGLAVVDVSVPAEPYLLSRLDVPSVACGVWAGDGLAFVACGDGELVVVDVAEPAAPGVVGTAILPGPARDVVVAETFAYVACDSGGVAIVDVGQPANPVVLSVVSLEGATHGVAVAGSLVLGFGYSSGVSLIDVTDPASPALLGSLASSGAFGIDIVDGLAYVASLSGLAVHDISDPQQPVSIGSLALPNSYGVTVADDIAYVAGEKLTPGYPVWYKGRLTAVDVSDPASPEELGFVMIAGESATDVAVSGDFAFVAGYQGGLFVAPTHCEVVGAPDAAADAMARGPRNHPNPFNPRTTITYEIERRQPVELDVFDLRGRLIATLVNAVVPAGFHEVVWNGRDGAGLEVSAGVYLSRLETGGRVTYGRMALVR